MTRLLGWIGLLVVGTGIHAGAFNHADTLRGSNGTGRNWWKVTHYELSVAFGDQYRSIQGSNAISLRVTAEPHDSMQIDLQEPMIIDSAVADGSKLTVAKEGNVWWATGRFSTWAVGSHKRVIVYYHGTPRGAKNPPWDGGFSRTKDDNGKDWIAVSCQGLGASVWWPCKDAQWEEPDSGMVMHYVVPNNVACIGNGRLVSKVPAGDKTTWTWQVANPINNYDATFYIGDYITWHDTLMGEKGVLDLSFAVLRSNEAKARKEFKVVKQMIHCFEYWLGPYPFYEDGYQLVEAPYLGMEHQGAIAYGNKYTMGYLGGDRTGTGIGMDFDYIIIHESGHEWFGNSVTAADIADNWIQEGITTYAESLFSEWIDGTDKGKKYCRGEWNNILNNRPIIGQYGVNEEGAPDMYDKGAAIMYMLRQWTDDDRRFRTMLRGLSAAFYHKTVTTKEVEASIAAALGLDLQAFFDQYLRSTRIPEIEYFIADGQLNYRFNNVVAGFTLPVQVTGRDTKSLLDISADWKHTKWKGGYNVNFVKDYLFTVKDN